MTLLPHTLSAHILVPLRRGFESFDDLPTIDKRCAQLIDRLYQPLSQDEKIEPYFLLQKMLSYPTASGERSFKLPCLHKFFMPTYNGMKWLKNRFFYKNRLDVELITSAKGFLELLERAKALSVHHATCFILHDPADFNMHVTPFFMVKNSNGLCLYNLDSINRESETLTHEFFQDSLNGSGRYFVSKDARQVDGFSCRVEAFLMLKSLYSYFLNNSEVAPHDILCEMNTSSKNPQVTLGLVRGAFMKTSQRIIEDKRADECVWGTKVSLGDMQKLFYAGCLKHIEEMGAIVKSEFYQGSVYLQCKTLKYVSELKQELDEAEKKYAGFEFRTDADF